MSITMKAWFRAVAAGFGAPAPAQTVAGILLLALVIVGVAIGRPRMLSIERADDGGPAGVRLEPGQEALRE